MGQLQSCIIVVEITVCKVFKNLISAFLKFIRRGRAGSAGIGILLLFDNNYSRYK